MSQSEEEFTAANQGEAPAVGGEGEPVAGGESQPVAAAEDQPVAESEAQPIAESEGEAAAAENGGSGKTKAAAVVAGTGAAVAGIAGGIAVAARDTRRRVLGVPLGKRSRFQRGASVVVDKVQEPARRLGSRFSRD